MIIRASNAIRALFCVDMQPKRETEEPWTPVVMDTTGPRKLSIKKKSNPDNLERAGEHVKELVPQWLGEALMEGSVIIMPQEDFLALDEQVKEHLEVVSS